jgi:hypothetical protein
MSKISSQFCAVLLFLLAARSASAADLPDEGSTSHMGVATCATSQCHGSAVPREGSNVLQNEYVTWTQDDPHSQTFATLGGNLSRAIANRLGLPSAAKADICLDCHADNVALKRQGDRFQISDGVGCESCHGGAENWLATHYDTANVTHEDNIASGLYPTEVAESRAELCLGCHLGTRDKFATHRIMAAGHPRLAFELDTFTELWRTAGRQPHFRIDADYAMRKDTPDHTTLWVAGLFAEAGQRLALVASDASEESVFPELGLYDCHACHRSMKSVNWRALSRHGGAGPGVPFLNDGTFVMILALTNALDQDRAAELQTALGDLHAASGKDVATLRTAAQALDDLLRNLRTRITPTAVRGRERLILREVLQFAADGNFLDYASAEQAFMAVQMLVIELDDPSLEAQLDTLANALLDDEQYQPDQFAELLQAMGAEGVY